MERILDKLGAWHIPVFILALTGSMPYGLFVMSLSYMAPKMTYWCKPPSNINDSLWFKLNEGVEIKCQFWKNNSTHKCHEWEYDHSEHQRTLIEQVSVSGTRRSGYVSIARVMPKYAMALSSKFIRLSMSPCGVFSTTSSGLVARHSRLWKYAWRSLEVWSN